MNSKVIILRNTRSSGLPDLNDVMYPVRQEKRRCSNGSPVRAKGKRILKAAATLETPASAALHNESVPVFYCKRSSCDIDFQESWGLKFFPIERGPPYLRSKSIHRVEE